MNTVPLVPIGDADLLPMRFARIALRDNPRRRHLIVSMHLGKHEPIPPRRLVDAGGLLGARAGAVLRNAEADPAAAVVIGFAETATALSDVVAVSLGARRAGHSTRYASAAQVQFEFTEHHSHAAIHQIVRELLVGPEPSAFVLVDDELTSGRTAQELARELRSRFPAVKLVIATLVDGRADTDPFIRIDGDAVPVVALFRLHADEVAAAVERWETALSGAGPAVGPARPSRGSTTHIPRAAPAEVWFDTARGWEIAERAAITREAGVVAAQVERALQGADVVGGDVLVLGDEEFMAFPLMVASALEEASGARTIWYSSTTRSPGRVLDVEDYGLRHAVEYAVTGSEFESTKRFAYNTGVVPGTRRAFAAIVLCRRPSRAIETGTADSLLDGLSAVTTNLIVVDLQQATDPEAT